MLEYDINKLKSPFEDQEKNKKIPQILKAKVHSILESDNSQKNMFDLNSFFSDNSRKLPDFQNYNIQKKIAKTNKEKITFDFFDNDQNNENNKGGIIVNVSQIDYDYDNVYKKNEQNNKEETQKKGIKEKINYGMNESSQQGSSSNNDISNKVYSINQKDFESYYKDNNYTNNEKWKISRKYKNSNIIKNNGEKYEDEVFHYYKKNKFKNKCYKFCYRNQNKNKKKSKLKRNKKFCDKHPFFKWFMTIIIIIMLIIVGIILCFY